MTFPIRRPRSRHSVPWALCRPVDSRCIRQTLFSRMFPRQSVVTVDGGGPGVPFEPGAVRYIKLGENGKWATCALERGIIPFGYRSVDHQARLAGNWDEVRRQLVGMGRTARGVSQGLRELKDFYGLPEDTLWVTMADGHFWWAFAEGPVIGVEQRQSDEPARYRRTRAGWSKTNLTGEPLTVRSLSSALNRELPDDNLHHQACRLFAASHSRGRRPASYRGERA